MTRRQIEYILTLDRLRNFGKAADACFVTQSTLSAMVAKFEQQIGISLFDRKTKPISPTVQGEKIIDSLKSVHREMRLLDDTINDIKGYEEGNFSIACIPTVAPYLYPLVLTKISKNYPKVDFTIHELTTKKIVKEIITGNIDIGIVSTPLEDKEMIEYPLYQEDFLLYDCGKTLESKNYRISDIDLNRLWLMEEGHCLRNQVGKICELRQQKKVNGNLIYSCGTIFTLIEMVKRNRGVTLIPRLSMANLGPNDAGRIYELSDPVPTREIGLITHKNFVKKRMLRYLIKTIQNAVKSHLPVKVESNFIVKPFN